MRIERVRNASRNMAYGVALQAMKTLVPFAMRTVMLYLLGVEYLGLNSLFTSVLSVLNLAELGVGSAMVYSMYRPIAEDDTRKICALMRLYKIYYRIIGLVVCVLGLLLVPFLPRLISGSVPPDVNLYVLYLLNLAATVFSYWLFAYRSSVLQAHQRNDVVSKVTLVTDTLKYLLQFAVLAIFRSYYLYVMAILGTQILNNILTAVVAGRMYPEYRARGSLDRTERRSINHRIADLFTAKVGSVIVYSSDTIVISAFLGLSALAIYQNYYYIFTAVTSVVTIVFTSVRAGLGNSIIVDGKEKVFADFRKFLLIIAWISGFCCACFLCLYQPFMVLWVGPDLLLDFGVVICLVVYFYVHCMNVFLNSYKDAAGMWHEDRFRPLVEALANLTLNIVLVQHIGLYGVVLSTILSMLLVAPWLVHNLFSLILDRRHLGQFVRRMGYYALMALVAAVVTYCTCRLVSAPPAGTFVTRLVLCVFVANAVILVFLRRVPEFGDCLTLIDHVSGGRLGRLVALVRRGVRRA